MRAAIVMPAVFAFADRVVGQPQTTIFAAFGSFAILVLADFSGRPRTRLAAYVGLAAVGAVLIPLGTLCSRGALVGAAGMAVVGFTVLFSGVVNRHFAAGGFAALLTFILSANVAAPVSAVPERLAGWALACGAGISAVMLLWPARTEAELHAPSARACAAVADAVELALEPDAALVVERTSAAREAVAALRRHFFATFYRPTGSTGSTAAMAVLVDGLDWLLSLLPRAAGEAAGATIMCHDWNREVVAAAAAVLRTSAKRLHGRDVQPDLDRLERAREAVTEALAREAAELPAAAADAELLAALEPSFRLRELSYAAGEIGMNALRATGRTPVDGGARRRVGAAAGALAKLVAAYASLRSSWFRNSARAAAALAVATFVAQQASLQHAFWVVLGTFSVLRSSALATGATVVSALGGTAVGIVVGVALILAIGTDERVLWAVLPVAVLLAAYAPRAISFGAGQAGFTVVVLVLFNLIQPTGWTVGLIRVEDVAIGFAISLGIGALFWPRGAGALVRRSLADSFARDADYVAGAVRALQQGPVDGSVQAARRAARAAAHRLDDAFRQLLAEPRAEQLDLQSVGTLVAGAARAGLAADSIVSGVDGAPGPACRASVLDREVAALRSWYVDLGDALARAASPPPPNSLDGEGRKAVLRCLRDAVAGGDEARTRAALGLLRASRSLDNLRRLERHLHEPATRLSAGARPASPH